MQQNPRSSRNWDGISSLACTMHQELNSDLLCPVGWQVVVFRGGAVLINPDGVGIAPEAAEVHGIQESDLQDCP
jgi:hypothetical protein